jgi:hypothetical protein
MVSGTAGPRWRGAFVRACGRGFLAAPPDGRLRPVFLAEVAVRDDMFLPAERAFDVWARGFFAAFAFVGMARFGVRFADARFGARVADVRATRFF